MSRFRQLLKPALSLLIVVCVVWFFGKAFRANWADVQAHEFQLSVPYLIAAALVTLAAILLATYAWYRSINTLSTSQVDFRQSIAAANVSGLTKYIPGKVWSYALQMYWLDGLGIGKALIVYVGLLNLAISMGVSVMFGLICLLFGQVAFPARVLFGALLGLLAFDALAIGFNRALLHALVSLINRVFKRTLSAFDVTKSLLLELLDSPAGCGCLGFGRVSVLLRDRLPHRFRALAGRGRFFDSRGRCRVLGHHRPRRDRGARRFDVQDAGGAREWFARLGPAGGLTAAEHVRGDRARRGGAPALAHAQRAQARHHRLSSEWRAELARQIAVRERSSRGLPSEPRSELG